MWRTLRPRCAMPRLLKSQMRPANRAEVPTHLAGAPRRARELSLVERYAERERE